MSVCIQFTGDILCQIQQTEACTTTEGLDYGSTLAHIETDLKTCDYLVGNLETPVAGEALGYSDRMYQFNTPEPFLKMLKKAGFDLFSTANNHCMDRGVEGLFNTLDALDREGFAHIGTYRSKQDRDEPFIVKIGDITFGFVSYTYGTNAFFHHMYLPDDMRWAVNLLQPEELKPGSIDLLDDEHVTEKVAEFYKGESSEYKTFIEPYLEQLKDDIFSLKKSGVEIVIVLLHCGGQHQLEPDAYTRWIAQYLEQCGADLVVGNHQHILHPYKKLSSMHVAYCLGNLTDTPDSNPNGRGIGEEYSILLRIYFSKKQNKAYIEKSSFILVKSVLDESNRSVVKEVANLINEEPDLAKKKNLIAEAGHFVNLVRGTNEDLPQLCHEYVIG